MAKRCQKRGIGKRLSGLFLMLVALSALLAPGAPASAAPTRTEQTKKEPVAQVEELARAAVSKPSKSDQTAAVKDSTPQKEAEEPAAPPSAMVPEAEVVEDSYFSGVVFLGDSRTEGFFLYSGLQEGTPLFAVGATVESVFTKATQKTSKGTVPLLDALQPMECDKIYVMLGVNELGWNRAETFQTQYGKVIDRLRADHPNAQVVIQSILPVSKLQDDKKSYVNNERIRVYNELLEELAIEKACPYINVAEAVTGEDGCLQADLTFDGIHLNPAGCKLWLSYLKTHPVWSEAV